MSEGEKIFGRTTGLKALKCLDIFCGLGGWSKGFVSEGFECVGVDIVDVGYPYQLILKDVRELDAEWVKAQRFDVIVGSPPCRDFSIISKFDAAKREHGQKGCWRIPPNPQDGLKLVYAFLKIVEEAKPPIWLMENSPFLADYITLRSIVNRAYLGKTMRRSFWGVFPSFLVPMDLKKQGMERGRWGKLRSWERAEIPFIVAQAFAHACKQKLLEVEAV